MIGANGAGKSTLLRTIAGLHEPTEGTVLLDGEDVTSVTPERRLVAGIALVPEGRRLFPSLTVEENLLVGSYHSRPGPWDLERVYELFGWMRERTHQRTAQLSGGEQQAVAIGRALVANPRVLLLDELSLGLAPVVGPADLRAAAGAAERRHDGPARRAGRQSGRARGIAHPMPPRRTNHAGGSAGSVHPRGDRGRVLRPVHDGIGVVSWVNAIVQGILVGGLFALFACGLSLLFGTMKVINLAHGDLAVVAAFLAVELAPVFHIPIVCVVPVRPAVVPGARLRRATNPDPSQPGPRSAHDAPRHVRSGDRHREPLAPGVLSGQPLAGHRLARHRVHPHHRPDLRSPTSRSSSSCSPWSSSWACSTSCPERGRAT